MNIELEDTATLKAWLEKFDGTDDDVLTLPGVPYSYPSIVREILRRDFIQDISEDMS